MAKKDKPMTKPTARRPKAFANFPAMNAKLWPLDRIKPYGRNARTHPPAQIELLAELFRKYGVDQPIVVDENGVILKGHGRRLAAIKAEIARYPVVQRVGLTDAEKTAMRIEDNQVALLSGWDNELIRGEIALLESEGYEIRLLGFGEAELVSFRTVPGPPDAFPKFGEDVPTEFCCPRCQFKWSGNAKPKDDAETEPKKASRRRKAS